MTIEVAFLSPVGVVVNSIESHENTEGIPVVWSVKWAIKNHGG